MTSFAQFYVTCKVVKDSAAAAGLQEIAAVVDEMSMDVPKFGNYVAKTVASLLASGVMSPLKLKEVLSPLEVCASCLVSHPSTEP